MSNNELDKMEEVTSVDDEVIIDAYNATRDIFLKLKSLPKNDENKEQYEQYKKELNENSKLLSQEQLKQIIDSVFNTEKRQEPEIKITEPVDEVSYEEVEEEKVETLEKTVLINRINTNITEPLWIETESIRKNINSSKQEEKVTTKKPKSKSKGLNTGAFVSVSVMATITAIVSIGIVILGIGIVK